MSPNKLFSSLTLVLTLATYFTSASAQDALNEARRKVEQSSAAEEAMRAAQASNDIQTAEERRRQVGRLLREARDLYAEADAAEARDPELLSEYARLLERTDDPDLAAAVLTRLTSLSPDDAEAWVRLGKALSRLGESKALDAKSAFDRALSLEAEPAVRGQAYAGLGRLYYDLGLYELAEETLIEVLPLASQDIETIIALAALHLRRGSVIVAADTLDSVGPALAPYSVLLQGYLVKALADFDLNRVWFPDAAPFHLAYAKLLYRAGRLSEAMGILERSLELNDENHVSWNLLGSFRSQAGNIEGAREAFTHSLALNPRQPRTRQSLDALSAPPE